jgi:hypothetical protein
MAISSEVAMELLALLAQSFEATTESAQETHK